MIKPTITGIIFLIIMAVQLPAQEFNRDSAVKVLESARPDSNKVNLLNDLARNLFATSPDEALAYSLQSAELAKKLDFTKGLAYAYKNAGMAKYTKSQFAECLMYCEQARLAFEACGDKSGVANMVSNMGVVYNNFGEDTKAISLYFEARKVAEEIGDSLRIVTTMINIGTIYLKKPDNIGKAIGIFLEALPIAEAIRNRRAIGTTTLNLGEAYFKKNDLPSALVYYKRALEVFDGEASSSLAYTYTGIGNIYARQNDFERALESQKRALKIAEDLNARQDMVTSLLGLAETYKLMKDIPSAIASYNRAREIAIQIPAFFELRDSYIGLADLHASLSDYRSAFQYQKLLTGIKDSIYLSSNDNLIQQQQLGYDLVKKEGEVKVQKIAVQKQKVVKNAFLAGLLLILAIAFIIFRNYLDKVKVNRLLDKQKAQIESLLLNILPVEVARELQEQGSATPRDYPSVTVLFTDFKEFSRIAEGLSPNQLVAELNQFFHAFDNIMERHNLEKIKTIGDSYMCAGGIPTANSTHPTDAVRAGLEMQEFMLRRNTERALQGLEPWGLRVGVHTGPVVAGVVGSKKYAYDIWGSAVNIASRMESNGAPGRVNISSATYELVKDVFACEHRGKISAKNIGEIDMYFIANNQTNLN